MERRQLFRGLAAVVLGAAVPLRAQAQGSAKLGKLHSDWMSFLPAGIKPPLPTEPMKLADAEWRKRLTPAAFEVLRKEGTERAGSSPLDAEKRAGVFVCAGCDLPLFTSAMKYDSGTGWPSFFTTIPGVFGIKRDYKLLLPRVEYHCLRCGGHHGHVFDDGPAPTGKRYCNNGIALKFLPKA